MNPNEIRGAVQSSEADPLVVEEAALAYANSLDDPIWWCFQHGSAASPKGSTCEYPMLDTSFRVCDIAKATRPRRLDSD